MSIVPQEWTPTASAIFYSDARASIAWLEKAFGFTPRIVDDEAWKKAMQEVGHA